MQLSRDVCEEGLALPLTFIPKRAPERARHRALLKAATAARRLLLSVAVAGDFHLPRPEQLIPWSWHEGRR